MSRHARHDIDLSALPTVADVDDDDLIDRDEKWHEYQRLKEAQPAPTPVEELAHHPEPDPVYHHEPEPEPEFVEAPAPASALLEIQPPRTPEVMLAEEPEEVIQPPAPVQKQVKKTQAREETPPVSFGLKAEERSDEAETSPKAERHIEVPKPPPAEPLSAEEEKQRWWQTWKAKIGASSLGISVGVHALILIIGGLITVRHVMNKQVDFLPGGNPVGQAASEALEHKVRQKKNPWLKNKPPMQRVSVQSLTTDVQLPEMDMETLDLADMTDRLEIGKLSGLSAGMGAGGSGGGFGAGIGKGGMFSFLGQTAFGRRVVFVVDVSASMSQVGKGGVSRFDVLKKELAKSLSRIPTGTHYQILFFSDFAWPHNTIDPKKGTAFEKYRWSIVPEDWKSAKIPLYNYIHATPFSLAESKKIVQESDNPGGTNWGSGLLMALKGTPKPDAIFFMTDGQKSDEMGWVDIVTNENQRTLPRTAIHTSVMMETGAAADMDRLAKANGGSFSVVLNDGTVVKGDQFSGN